MKIGLIEVDSIHPNLALMKLSAYHKSQGDQVEWYTPFTHYDRIYMSKIFNFTDDYGFVINNADEIIKGGTGYDLTTTLPEEVEYLQPDYTIYPTIDKRTAYGFLTRGCPNKCKWCVVPKKEGGVRPYMDIEDIAIDGRDHVVLMDNNILASEYGLNQIEKIIKLGLYVDFNQALDARLVTDEIAKNLAKVKWIKRIRFGCDTQAQIHHCEEAIWKITDNGYKGEFLLCTIITDDFDESLNRITYWRKNRKVVPFAQPFRSPIEKNIIPMWQRDMARWTNRKELFFSIDFKDYEPRKGFKCANYFNQ